MGKRRGGKRQARRGRPVAERERAARKQVARDAFAEADQAMDAEKVLKQIIDDYG
jgi:hypothetical protein